uniref:Uncharacterized protein n=1 Tax=Rhizophora mucronata TaxID=61149 RepID=A0A2P2Q0F4_RHIMU
MHAARLVCVYSSCSLLRVKCLRVQFLIFVF